MLLGTLATPLGTELPDGRVAPKTLRTILTSEEVEHRVDRTQTKLVTRLLSVHVFN